MRHLLNLIYCCSLSYEFNISRIGTLNQYNFCRPITWCTRAFRCWYGNSACNNHPTFFNLRNRWCPRNSSELSLWLHEVQRLRQLPLQVDFDHNSIICANKHFVAKQWNRNERFVSTGLISGFLLSIITQNYPTRGLLQLHLWKHIAILDGYGIKLCSNANTSFNGSLPLLFELRFDVQVWFWFHGCWNRHEYHFLGPAHNNFSSDFNFWYKHSFWISKPYRNLLWFKNFY